MPAGKPIDTAPFTCYCLRVMIVCGLKSEDSEESGRFESGSGTKRC